ncbi:DeoR/GlpR family DNA-binding transcription regulator [Neobacillus sp. PS3-34]|uniref:DeoR/GlpR family DNA-binding transcription regulator n=1 Tax=Neobacillus sp. PS3-34 TaxID=3070678 RepID=UPI0027E0E18A|nr:DeoR/GlpR family DNA-binding transcription regulator [Neobacillus sp. PS3-34]WML48389.1 DeoR/GlpR family DNA-binding transcription regulator [Neobacillus sp. PS3-34]
MFSDERRQQILKMLEQNERVLAKDLAELFQLSIDSIRRDLSIMEDQGLLKRTHGGAIPVPIVRTMPSPPSIRYGEANAYQNAIAKTAVSYIHENQTVFIGGASIHFAMVKYMPKEFPFTVLTNSIEIACQLKNFENVQIYLIGGHVKNSGNITDALANEFARQFTVDLCFATAGALSSEGLSTASPEVSIFHKTVYDHSQKIIALIEHNKFGVDMFSRMYPLDGLDLIITDEETTADKLELIRAKDVEVLVAK